MPSTRRRGLHRVHPLPRRYSQLRFLRDLAHAGLAERQTQGRARQGALPDWGAVDRGLPGGKSVASRLRWPACGIHPLCIRARGALIRGWDQFAADRPGGGSGSASLTPPRARRRWPASLVRPGQPPGVVSGSPFSNRARDTTAGPTGPWCRVEPIDPVVTISSGSPCSNWAREVRADPAGPWCRA